MAKLEVNGKFVVVSRIPEKCPYCHHSIYPTQVGEFSYGDSLDIMFCCPRQQCGLCFIGHYQYDIDRYSFKRIATPTLLEPEMSDIITGISSNFVKIYSDAFKADQLGLRQICGAGYRKALEFLIKDYLIGKKRELKGTIAKKQLGPCIKDHVDNESLKDVAMRAAWLGNDEVHYSRLWEEMDLKDLKDTIGISVRWIEMMETTEQIKARMLEPRKHK